LGRNTALISIYETVFAASLSEQKQFLAGLEKTVLNHPDVNDLSAVYLWFRDRYCELFSNNPTHEMRDLVLKKLKKLFAIAPIGFKEYVADLIKSANSYMARELSYFSSATPVKYSPKLFTIVSTPAPVKSGSKRNNDEETYTKRQVI
jgi:hypothetical protein